MQTKSSTYSIELLILRRLQVPLDRVEAVDVVVAVLPELLRDDARAAGDVEDARVPRQAEIEEDLREGRPSVLLLHCIEQCVCNCQCVFAPGWQSAKFFRQPCFTLNKAFYIIHLATLATIKLFHYPPKGR